jgi:hypothetical protein
MQSIDTPLWSARLPNGEIRSGTIEQLNEAFRAGHVPGGTPVCPSGSNRWTTLADVLNPEVWQVRLADGQVRTGTRQQLEEAFRAGHLAEDALVLRTGSTQWMKLGTVMARPPSFAPPPAPLEAPPPPAPSMAPTPAVVEAAPAPPPAPDPAEETPMTPAVDAVQHASQETPEAPEQASAAPDQDEPSPASAAEGETPPQATVIAEARHQVQLTDGQLEAAFLSGLLDNDSLVLAAGADQWVRLGDLRSRADTQSS